MRLGNPSFTLFLTLFLSFFMWLFPDFSILRSGFRQKAELLSKIDNYMKHFCKNMLQ